MLAGIAQTSLPTHTTTDHHMMEIIALGPAILDISPVASAANEFKAQIMGRIMVTTAATLAAHRLCIKILTVLLQATLCGQGQELSTFVQFF